MLRFAFLALCVACLTGCGPAGYRFAMQKPVASDTMAYEDDSVKVVYRVEKDSMNCNIESGVLQYEDYTGIDFIMENKTDKVLTIDWNKLSFKDPAGNSGPVFHNGIRFIDRSGPKVPTTIPPQGRINDIVIPCDAAQLGDNGNWKVSLFPSPRKIPQFTYGIYFPVEIGETAKTYEFEFTAKADQ
jgi:hypothetical protein